MIFTETRLPDAFVIDPEPYADERGLFARTFCAREFAEHGLDATTVQCNVSLNRHRGTVRGMHWQAAPHQEAKLVRCSHGAIYDVIVDLRPDSPRGLRHDDPALGIDWPAEVRVVSERDRSWPDWKGVEGVRRAS